MRERERERRERESEEERNERKNSLCFFSQKHRATNHPPGGAASGALGATGAAYPVTDDAGNLLSTEFGLCTYTDCQTVTVQELPESAPAGQLPRSVDVVLEHDLVDACKPGDRVSVSGVYRAAPPRASGVMSGVFYAVLLGASVRKLTGGPGGGAGAGGDGAVTADDIENIESLAASPDVLRQLAASLAPSIYGHDLVKLGLVLQLLGGRERELAESGTRLRGCAAVFFGFFFLVFFSLPSLSFFSRPDKTHAPSSLE